MYRICKYSSSKQVEPEIVYNIHQVLLNSSKLYSERRNIESAYRQQIGWSLEKVVENILEKKLFLNSGNKESRESLVLKECIERICKSYQVANSLNSKAATKFNPDDRENTRRLFLVLVFNLAVAIIKA